MSYNLIFSSKHKIVKNKKNLFINERLFIDETKRKGKQNNFFKYSFEKKEKIKAKKYVKKIYINVLKNLCPILNKLHSKNYDIKNWELLIFYFLSNYIYFSYYQWCKIKKIKKNFDLTKVEIFLYKKDYHVYSDTREFFFNLTKSDWNDWLVSKIIEHQKIKHVKKIILTQKKKINYNNISSLKIKNIFKFKNKNKFFFKNIELPLLAKFLLNFKLKQLNIFNEDLVFKNYNISSNQREFIKFKNVNNKFENFIYKTLPNVLPTSFIENYQMIEKNLKYLRWPKNPKIIITSYDHIFNDIFKIYSQKHIRNKCKFYIMQHGHQAHGDLSATSYETRVCDKYLSWGNKDKNKKFIPLFSFTNFGKKIKKKKKKDILISYTEFPLCDWKSSSNPSNINDVKEYKENILYILNKLDKKILNRSSIKYYDGFSNRFITRDLKKIYKYVDFINTNKIKRGFEFAKNFKLSIETINSTSFLESLSLNLPVILVTSKNFFDIKKEYKIYYRALIDAKIIFFDNNELTNFVNNNLENIDTWWFDKDRQKKINFFCKHMCVYEKNFQRGVNNLVKIFR